MPQEPLSQHPGGPQPPVGYEQPAPQPPFEQAPQSAAAATVYWKGPRKSRDGLWHLSQLSRCAWCRFSVLCLAPQLLLAWAGRTPTTASRCSRIRLRLSISTAPFNTMAPRSPDGLKQQLDVTADDSRIIAVVLRVNSGGGVATAGEEMSTYVKEFREDTGKPVVVSSASTNASAAYEISSQADYIFTAHTTAIGAIGTAIQVVDYSGLMTMLGISTEDITSAESKDSTYGTRKLTDEERGILSGSGGPDHETFIQTVADGRNMSVDEVRALATGLNVYRRRCREKRSCRRNRHKGRRYRIRSYACGALVRL